MPRKAKENLAANTTYTLIIWAQMPEEVRLFLVPDSVANTYRSDLAMAHNRYINSDEENPGLVFLNWAFCDPKYTKDRPPTLDEEDVGCLLQYEIHLDPGKPIQSAISSVVQSGFFL